MGAENENEMNISPELFEAWKKFLRHGDVSKMTDQLPFSRPIIDRALKIGYVRNPALSDAISAWFLKRKRDEEKKTVNESQIAKDLINAANQ